MNAYSNKNEILYKQSWTAVKQEWVASKGNSSKEGPH